MGNELVHVVEGAEYQGEQEAAYREARDYFARELIAHMAHTGGIESWQQQLREEPDVATYLAVLLDILSSVVADGGLQDMQDAFGQYLRQHTINPPSIHSYLGLYGIPNSAGPITWDFSDLVSPEEAAVRKAAQIVGGEIGLLVVGDRLGRRRGGTINTWTFSSDRITVMAIASNEHPDGRGAVFSSDNHTGKVQYYAGPGAFDQAAAYQSGGVL